MVLSSLYHGLHFCNKNSVNVDTAGIEVFLCSCVLMILAVKMECGSVLALLIARQVR